MLSICFICFATNFSFMLFTSAAGVKSIYSLVIEWPIRAILEVIRGVSQTRRNELNKRECQIRKKLFLA